MAIRLKSADMVAKKYAANAGRAGGDYTEGISNPKRDQAQAAAAAADTYAQGVQAAIADGRFAKGVNKAGSEKWKRKASTVGSQRFTQGVAAAQGDFQAGVKDFLDVIAATDLPPRFPKGDPRNLERVRMIAERLRAKKVAA